MAPNKMQQNQTGISFLEAKPGRPMVGKLGVSGGGVAKEQKPKHQQQQQNNKHEQLHSTTTSARDLPSKEEAAEELLRSFDMNSKYGPCIGMTRLARWERAQRFGKAPPPEVKEALVELLKEQPDHVQNQCLWFKRV